MKNEKSVAMIVLGATGYHLSDVSLSYIDTRGKAFPSRRAAIAEARQSAGMPGQYTHYLSPDGREVRL